WAKNPEDESERPYFLGGNTKKPAYTWRWVSEPAAIQEGTSTGLGHFSAFTSAQVTQSARYADGQWQLVLTPALTPSDTTQAPRWGTGRAIPVAFFAADGSNGEDDIRGAVSTWYAVFLDVPTPSRVFVAPLATIVLSAGLGMLLVTRAQRRDRGGGADSN